MYHRLKELDYYSPRYRKHVIVEKGFASDGATGAEDIYSNSWWVHDKICATGKWSDGSRITNWQASMVLHDVLKAEGWQVRAVGWFVATFLFGGGEARKNGMFHLRLPSIYTITW